MAAIQQKRKRDDESDMAAPRPAPNAPALNAVDHDFSDAYLQDEAMDEHPIDFDAAFPAPEQETTATAEAEEQAAAQQQPAKAAQPTTTAASDTAAAAMAQYHTMTVPQSTEQSFMSGQKGDGGAPQEVPSVDPGSSTAPRTSSFGDFEAAPPAQTSPDGGDASPDNDPSSMTPSRGKPPVGTEEWHKIRKDNHKEVERRRRETINEGINELAKIVPGCEKNKGSILSRAVQFITQLKENETQNIEKWTLEKLLTEQAIAELSSSVDKLKAECQRAWAECEQWKRAAQKAGVGPEGKGVEGDAEGEDVD